MKISNAYFPCLSHFNQTFFRQPALCLVLVICAVTLVDGQHLQEDFTQSSNDNSELSFYHSDPRSPNRFMPRLPGISSTEASTKKDTVPEPVSVMYKSLFVPGWGQAVNEQYWKIPVIYAALGGVIAYTVYLDGKYDDFRAAYYNSNADEETGRYTDEKFGPTPDYLEGVVTSQLRFNRNYYRNTRDLMFIMTGLAYGLNVLDAYIFAHLRDFDVSDDLSVQTSVQSGPAQTPMVSLKFQF